MLPRMGQRLDPRPGPFLLDVFGEAVQCVGRSEALDQHDGARQLGEDARPLGHDLAAEAVADDKRPLEFAVEEHGVQVGDVVDHRVDAGMRALAVAAQVVGDHPVVGGERLRDRRERQREVLDAVSQQDRGTIGGAPLVDLELRAAGLDAAPAERSRFKATRNGGCGYGQRVSTSGKPLSARVRFRSASGPASVAPKRSSCSASWLLSISHTAAC